MSGRTNIQGEIDKPLLPASLRRVTNFFGAGVALLAGLGLLGWIPGLRFLSRIKPDYIPMAPSTAVSFILVSTVLLISIRKPWQSRRNTPLVILTTLVSIFGLLEVIEYFTSLSLNFEDILVPRSEMLGSVPTARMSPATGALFFMAGISLLLVLLTTKNRSTRVYKHVGGILGSLVIISGLTFVMGYLLGTPLLYDTINTIPIAATTALNFLLLGSGLVIAVGVEAIPIKYLIGPSTHARLLRRFLPLVILAVLTQAVVNSIFSSYFDINNALLSALLTVIFTLVTGGVVVGVARSIGKKIDLTEAKRVRTEQALRESEEQFRKLMQESPISIEIYSSDGTMLDVNKAWEEMWGVDAKDVVDNYNPLKTDVFQTMGLTPLIERAFAGEQVEMPIVEFDPAQTNLPGRKRWLRSFVYHIQDGQDNIKNVVLLSEDITKQKQAEEALHQAQKTESLGVLAGGMAHDFNNLLVAMLGQTSLALAKLRDESPARSHIEKAVKAAERSADLTRQMLAYSGRGHFEICTVNLNNLIEENLRLFGTGMPKNVRLLADLAESLPLIDADTGQMQQILMNLIINGSQAIEKNPGVVTLVTGVQEIGRDDGRYHLYTGQKLPPGRYVSLEVHDNGRGMNSDTVSKIFDPFFTTKETGHGLGLAAVLGIIRGHNGGLHVYSEPNQGAIFKLVFPVSRHESVQQPATSARPQSQKTTGLVLVIDDEAPVREAVTDILAMENIETITAASGTDGLALYRERTSKISLVLLDLSMPGMNGEETFRELRRINPAVRVILSSGYNQVEATRNFSDKGLIAFVQKPYSMSVLIDVVKRYI